MTGFDEAPKLYKEKKWYKEEEGDKITHGYTLRGRHSLKKAVEGLKETLRKGVTKDVEGVHFRILDARKNGIALEIEVEMLDNKDKGSAMVKLYGPYIPKDKKDNVIMITKCKGSDSKFVTILAERIIKPLISGFIRGVNRIDNSMEVDKEDVYRCPFCEKTSNSSPGMKGHITKMHQTRESKLDKENG